MKFRMLLAALAVAILPNLASADPIFTAKYRDRDDVSFESLVLKTYNTALNARKANALQTAVNNLKREFKEDELGSVGAPDETSLFLLTHGKGSASSHGGTYLLGVPVSLNGSGLIEEYGLYVKVSYYWQMGESITITIENLVEITDK